MTAPTWTPNYNLIKPDPQAVVDVQNINDNSDKIDAGLSQTISVVDPMALITAYPMGTSMFRIQPSDISTYPNWQVAYGVTAAHVYTFRDGTDRGTQFWFRNYGPGFNADGWYRNMSTSGNSYWRKFADSDSGGYNGVADQSIPDNAWTKPTMPNSESSGSQSSISLGSGSVTIRDPGTYSIECNTSWTGGVNSASVLMGFAQAGDAGPSTFYRVSGSPATAGISLNGHWTKACILNETIALFVMHNSSGNAKTLQARRIIVTRVGPPLA